VKPLRPGTAEVIIERTDTNPVPPVVCGTFESHAVNSVPRTPMAVFFAIKQISYGVSKRTVDLAQHLRLPPRIEDTRNKIKDLLQLGSLLLLLLTRCRNRRVRGEIDFLQDIGDLVKNCR
jgi:hypothetical protein